MPRLVHPWNVLHAYEGGSGGWPCDNTIGISNQMWAYQELVDGIKGILPSLHSSGIEGL